MIFGLKPEMWSDKLHLIVKKKHFLMYFNLQLKISLVDFRS